VPGGRPRPDGATRPAGRRSGGGGQLRDGRRRGVRRGRSGGRRCPAPARCRHAAARAPGLGRPCPRREDIRRRGAAGQLSRAAGAQRCRADRAAPVQQRRGRPDHADPAQRRPRRSERLPGRGGRPGPARGPGQPGAAAGTAVGRGDRLGRTRRIDQPDHPAQHPRRRFRRDAVRGQPARREHRGDPVRRFGRRAARGPRPGADHGPGGAGGALGAGVRQARNQVAGGGHLGPDPSAGIQPA
jgi:hypothetical protein